MSKNHWWGGPGGGIFQGFPWGFNPGRQRFFETGEVRLAILSLLAEGPKHGYQLMKEMQDRSGGMYRASAGSVYPTLQQLEDEGLVRAETVNGRRVYHLTDEGRAELAADPEAVRGIWDRAEQFGDWGKFMRPEAIAILPWVSALVKAAMSAAVRADAERIRKILDRAKDELEGL
jgi:DNA-binding PadR family transcriptional regulator